MPTFDTADKVTHTTDNSVVAYSNLAAQCCGVICSPLAHTPDVLLYRLPLPSVYVLAAPVMISLQPLQQKLIPMLVVPRSG